MNLKNIVTVAAICGTAAWTAGVGARADDYAQWRGPQRTGISQEKGLLATWPKDGPRQVWQVKDLGYGFSTPAVAGNRVYLLSNTGPDNEFVQALNAKDGSRIWQTTLGSVGQPHQMPNYPGARSTPTVDKDKLYVMSSDGDIVCLQAATGKVVWSKNVRKEFGGKPGIWAYSESPLIDGDAVVCTPGGSQATLLALNKKTGDVIWKSAVPGGDDACYASIVIANIGGKKQYIQFLKMGLVGVDAKTGKFLWRFDKTADKMLGGNIPTPVSFESDVYSGTGNQGGALAHVKSSNGVFEAEQVYSSKKLPNSIGGSVKVGDYLYGTGGTTLYCVDFKTGYVKWEERSVAPGSVCYADGRLYIHGHNREVALVEATPEGYHELGRFTPKDPPAHKMEQAWTYPVVANGRLYIHELGTVWCYDVSGKK